MSRIGYNDISQSYVSGVDRQAQYAALVESILYSFVEMNGAMRNTQLPHMVALDGVVAVSYGVAPAPTVSPLSPRFMEEIEGTRKAINTLHEADVIEVNVFDSVSGLADILSNLARETTPYTVQIGSSI
jgi:CRISPR-associated protein Cst2